MVDLKTLSDINNRCKIARALSADSPDLFGGLPAVIFMGAFYQFPPVKGLPLWQEPRQGKDDEFAGFHIWRRFTNVIILDEQMRQASDLRFQDLLRRTRKGQLTRADLDLLNSKVIPADGSFHMDSVVSVVKLNSLRHRLNHLAMIQFAHRRNQRIYLFPAHHTRLPSMQQLMWRPFLTNKMKASTSSLHAWNALHDLGKYQQFCRAGKWMSRDRRCYNGAKQ
jgi:hypothetical protein